MLFTQIAPAKGITNRESRNTILGGASPPAQPFNGNQDMTVNIDSILWATVWGQILSWKQSARQEANVVCTYPISDHDPTVAVGTEEGDVKKV